jgi:hypothetical protein
MLAENTTMLDLCRHLEFKIAAVGREGVLGVSLDPLRRKVPPLYSGDDSQA